MYANQTKSPVNGMVPMSRTRHYHFSAVKPKYHIPGSQKKPAFGPKTSFSLKMASKCHKPPPNHELMEV